MTEIRTDASRDRYTNRNRLLKKRADRGKYRDRHTDKKQSARDKNRYRRKHTEVEIQRQTATKRDREVSWEQIGIVMAPAGQSLCQGYVTVD